MHKRETKVFAISPPRIFQRWPFLRLGRFILGIILMCFVLHSASAQRYQMQLEAGLGFTEIPFTEVVGVNGGYEERRHQFGLAPLFGVHVRKQGAGKWNWALGLQYQQSRVRFKTNGYSVREINATYDSIVYEASIVQGFDKFCLPFVLSHGRTIGNVHIGLNMGVRANLILPWKQGASYHEKHYGDFNYEKYAEYPWKDGSVKPVFPLHGQGILGITASKGNWELGLTAYLGYMVYFGNGPNVIVEWGPTSIPFRNNDYVFSLKYVFPI